VEVTVEVTVVLYGCCDACGEASFGMSSLLQDENNVFVTLLVLTPLVVTPLVVTPLLVTPLLPLAALYKGYVLNEGDEHVNTYTFGAVLDTQNNI
jgi:hypothetical protein